jgi:uncharacterized protein YjbI with pentapeptide repeats
VPLFAIGLMILVTFGVATPLARADEQCHYDKGYTLSDKEIMATIEAHKIRSVVVKLGKPFTHNGPVLCNSTILDRNFSTLELRYGDLRGVYFINVDLSNVFMDNADLRGAELLNSNLHHTSFAFADLRQARFTTSPDIEYDLIHSAMIERERGRPQIIPRVTTPLVASPSHRDSTFDFEQSHFYRTDLRGSTISSARIAHAYLNETRMDNVTITGSDLSFARIENVQLKNATLDDVIFKGARLVNVDLDGTSMTHVVLSDAQFEPNSAPAKGRVSDLIGLRDAWFSPGHESGLVLLRNTLFDSGLRDLEREVTFPIERWRTRYQLRGSAFGREYMKLEGTLDRAVQDSSDNSKVGFLTALSGMLRLVFFEWTTGYGCIPNVQ